MIDAIGQELNIGDEVFVTRFIDRGLDCACIGKVLKVSSSKQSALVMITSSVEHLSHTIRHRFEGQFAKPWNIEMRIKFTKLIKR